MNKELTILAKPGSQEVFISRAFDAPRALVFQAHTDPDLIVQFLGPDDLETKIDYWEMKSGGQYRYVSSRGNQSFGFHGVIHEVNSVEFYITQTFQFEGIPGNENVSLDFLMLEELPGDRTLLKIHSILPSVMARDMMIQSGMEKGISQGYARLDTLLSDLKNGS